MIILHVIKKVKYFFVNVQKLNLLKFKNPLKIKLIDKYQFEKLMNEKNLTIRVLEEK